MNGKTALIKGATYGIGKALDLNLLDRAWF